MPRLRRLSGSEVIDILIEFGFVIVSVKGSHHKLQRVMNGQKQTLHVPVHGKRSLAPGTLRSIYRQACNYIGENELQSYFYAM